MTAFSSSKIEELLKPVNQEISKKGLTLSLINPASESRETTDATTRAFMEYELFKWFLEEEKDAEARRKFISYTSGWVFYACLTGGLVIVAKDSSGQIVGSANVNRVGGFSEFFLARWLEKVLLYSKLIFSIFFYLGIPWFLFTIQSRKTIFRRIGTGMGKLEGGHEEAIPSSQEHLHLIELAADPAVQSSGVGTALLKALGAIADQYRLNVYLETDTERHRKYYERNGFEVRSTYVIKDGNSIFEPNFGMVRPCQ